MVFFAKSSLYSLKKSKTILRHTYHLLCRKKKYLPEASQEAVGKALYALQLAILNKNRKTADHLARETESLSQGYLKKSTFDHIKDFVFAVGFALIVAIVVRQMWFEFYEIPTGSMRPTLKEQDRLVVSKTNFGINVPLTPKHFLFEPSLVKRNGIFVFTGENMDIRDVDTLYFYLFPGKKQYIKRLIGKPGDILYFYGGLIYGIDEAGKDICSELQPPSLNLIEHIPFIDFDRKQIIPSTPINGRYSPITIYQMNEPVAQLSITPQGQATGQMLNPPQIHSTGAPLLKHYADMWGFKNFGTTRLLTKEQVRYLTDQDPNTMDPGILYLEIKHHPSLTSARLVQDDLGRIRPILGISTSIIPLQEHHVRAIFKNIYTARFEIQNHLAYRYGNVSLNPTFAPQFPNFPNGTYEYYDGKAYHIRWQGITQEIESTSIFCDYNPTTVQLLYNIGIEFDMRFSPQMKNQRLSPARYTYYRDGALYLLGVPIIQKEDPILLHFQEREAAKKNLSNPQNPYMPFVDTGAPLQADGSVDVDFIRTYGIKIPPKMYLALGDNHAMSADSREFGFVPQDNLRGGPEFIFWPPGTRFGTLNQPSYPFFNLPRTCVWFMAGSFILIGTIYWRRRNHLPLKHLKKY